MALKYETRVVAVGDGKDRTFDFECACGFASREWATKVLATRRGAEHTEEHETGEPASELVDFRDDHDLNGPKRELVTFEEAGL